jgi:hypothetical protein
MAESMTGEADLAAAAAHQHLVIEIGPLLDGLLAAATGGVFVRGVSGAIEN